MGNSGWPQRLQVAPSSPSNPTRLVSAMPSSMCCPVGFSRQCKMVSASSANPSSRSCADQTPTLFTQPPRLVLELTSGLTVTTRAAAAGASPAQPAAQGGLGRRHPGRRPAQVGGHGRHGRHGRHGGHGRRGAGRYAAPPEPSGRLRAQPACCAVRGRTLPRLVRVGAKLHRELPDLVVGQQRRVILRMSLDGQAITLDRVGQNDRGPAVSMAS